LIGNSITAEQADFHAARVMDRRNSKPRHRFENPRRPLGRYGLSAARCAGDNDPCLYENRSNNRYRANIGQASTAALNPINGTRHAQTV